MAKEGDRVKFRLTGERGTISKVKRRKKLRTLYEVVWDRKGKDPLYRDEFEVEEEEE